MLFNDRRRAKKAARAQMKTTLGMMAKTGVLRGTTPPSKDPYERARDKQDAHYERADVKYEAQYGLSRAPNYVGQEVSRKEALYRAAKRKDKGEI